jgi:RNA polymerase sigma-70 factor (ECF subfamily)
LLLRLRDVQDHQSWTTFVETYAPLLYRYCRHRGLQDADAADVTQEVLEQVARSIQTFEYQPERGRFRDWLGTVARHKVSRFQRKSSLTSAASGDGLAGEVLSLLAAPAPDPEWTDQFNARVLQVALERVRDNFEATTWRAFEMVWREERPTAEVAQELQVPIDTVYVAKSRVLKKLREEILVWAEDLRRWQRGEPVWARPVGRWERLVRWCRRNPHLAGLLNALLVTSLAGFAGVVWQWQRAESKSREADRQRALAETQAAEAEQQRGLAEEHLRQACCVVDQFYTQFSDSIFKSAPWRFTACNS